MKDVKTNLFYTKDLSEAAAMLCKKVILLRLEQEQNFYWFVFQDKEFCEQLSNAYWTGELQVSAKVYADSLKSLKERVFSRR